jgi:hypothetical protein
MDNKIFMHFPIEIEKGEDGTYKRVIVKGKASTPHQDKQGEWIDPMGCDIDDFKRISDDHIKGNSGTIGEIIKAHKDHEAVWIDEAELYPSLPQVQHIVKIADELKKRPNSKMQLSFSIEGSATERDTINPKRILKAKLTGAAVTLQPINQNATAELFAKSLNYDETDFDALEKSDSVEQKRYLYEWKDSGGVEYKLTKSFEIEKSRGEGSRGGKVIGHTRSGKPIYANLKQYLGKEYKDYKYGNPSEAAKGIIESHSKLHEKLQIAKEKAGSFNSPGLEYAYKKDLKAIHEGTNNPTTHLEDYNKHSGEDNEYRGSKSASKELIEHVKNYHKELIEHSNKAGSFLKPGVIHAAIKDITQKSTTAELEDDDSEDVLKKEELKKKTVSLIAKAIEEKRISKEKGKKMLKHFLNQ